jgi:hypothetical protein
MHAEKALSGYRNICLNASNSASISEKEEPGMGNALALAVTEWTFLWLSNGIAHQQREKPLTVQYGKTFALSL